MHRSRCVACCLLAVAAFGAPAAQTPEADAPKGFVQWTSARLTAAADNLERTIGDKAMVFETIGNYPGHSVYLVLRGRTGDAEVHDTESDVFVARRGKATLVLGGELIESKSLPRKQQRGTGIRGGVRRDLAPGDIVHIPPAVPHQLVVPPGERFMYDLVKFDEEPLQ